MKIAVGLFEESGLYVPEPAPAVVVWTRPGSGLTGAVITIEDGMTYTPDHGADVVLQDAGGDVTDPFLDLR